MKERDLVMGSEFDVNSITDLLGRTIDPKIKPLVVAFNMKDYPTTGSCEGHPLSDWRRRVSRKVGLGQAKLVFESERGLTYCMKSPEDGQEYHKTFTESPWVDLNPLTENKVSNLSAMIDAYNRENRVNWKVEPFNPEDTIYRVLAVPCYSLEEMQADIPRFAEHVLRS